MKGYVTIVDNSRRATAHTCGCGVAVLAGVDADRLGLNATVEPVALTQAGEWLAVLAGRTTYELSPDGRLHRRDRWSMRSSPRGDVVAGHRCRDPIPATWHAPPPPITATRTPDPERLEF